MSDSDGALYDAPCIPWPGQDGSAHGPCAGLPPDAPLPRTEKFMNFLLLSQLPRVDESRHRYDAMLNLESRETRAQALVRIWRRLASIFR